MTGAVLKKEGPAFVLGGPRHGAVNERLGKDHGIPGLDFRLDHIVCRAFKDADVFGQGGSEVSFVTPGNAGKSPVTRFGGGEEVRHHGETATYDPIATDVPVVRLPV